jgi:hypothetical protein
MMIFATILNFIAFIVILAELNWKWVDMTSQNRIGYAHSIFGILTISIPLFQVPEVSHRNEKFKMSFIEIYVKNFSI